MNVELQLNKGKGSDGKYQYEDRTLEIIKVTPLPTTNKLFLVKVGQDLEKEKTVLEINMVQFIASCKTENNIVFTAAFIISTEFGVMECVPTGENRFIEPDTYNNWSESEYYANHLLVDYDSYREICQITKEKQLNFTEYCKAQIKDESFLINKLYFSKDKRYNKNDIDDMPDDEANEVLSW